MNAIVIKGRLTRDPEQRTFDTGKAVTRFSVAVNRRFNREEADFFAVSAWGKLGELAQRYLAKGREVVVRGEMQAHKYTKDDETRTAWEIVAEEIDFCGGSGHQQGEANASRPADYQGMSEVDSDDDLPF